MWGSLLKAALVSGRSGAAFLARNAKKAGNYAFGKRGTGQFKNVRNAAGIKVPTELMRESRAASALNHAWQLDSTLNLVERITDRWFPKTTLAVSVKIWGSPQSNMSNLFYLACAVASNANPDVLGTGARSRVLTAAILPHDRFVQVNIALAAGGLLGPGGASGRTAVKAEIPDNYRADKVWPTFMENAPNEPLGSVQSIIPPGQTDLIATTLSADNPTPQLDNVSRQSDIIALITAALIGSCDKVPCPLVTTYIPVLPDVANRTPNATKNNPNQSTLVSLQIGPDGKVVDQNC